MGTRGYFFFKKEVFLELSAKTLNYVKSSGCPLLQESSVSCFFAR